jgi:SAM-dependent methyltransferase
MTQEAAVQFRQMIEAPSDEIPIVEMNEVSSRDIDVIWKSIESAVARWRGGRDACIPGMPMDRKELWGTFASMREANSQIIEEFIGTLRGEGQVAMDLGCGNSKAVKLLLQKGWRVIAIDNSRPALDALSKNCNAEISSGQLSIIETDVTTFIPTEPVDLVIASDLFPYIDPSKFQATWIKIHDKFVKEKGFLIGSLFRSAPTSKEVQVMNSMKEMGAWFLPDRRMVRPLLTHTGYDIKTCRYQYDVAELEPLCIQFVAEKKEQKML